MDQEKLVALLGRPLTPNEVTNFDLYIEIANESLQRMLCTDLESTTEAREYDARESHRTLFTDIFTEVQSVEIDGEEIPDSEYSVRQWDRRNGEWFNSIVFNEPRCGVVTVTADWGFDGCWPADLRLLIARLFDNITKQNNLDRTINSKKVEDFAISYNHSSITMNDTLMEQLVKDNRSIINRYKMCGLAAIQHGDLRYGRLRRIQDNVIYVS